MSSAKHYTPSEIRELRNIKRVTKEGKERNDAIRAWAIRNNRVFGGVYAKVTSLKVKNSRAYNKRMSLIDTSGSMFRNALGNRIELSVKSYEIDIQRNKFIINL